MHAFIYGIIIWHFYTHDEVSSWFSLYALPSIVVESMRTFTSSYVILLCINLHPIMLFLYSDETSIDNNNSTSILSNICSYTITLQMNNNSNTAISWGNQYEWCHCCADGLCKTVFAQAVCAIVTPSSFSSYRAPPSLHLFHLPCMLLLSKLNAVVVLRADSASQCRQDAGNDCILVRRVEMMILTDIATIFFIVVTATCSYAYCAIDKRSTCHSLSGWLRHTATFLYHYRQIFHRYRLW